MIEVYNSINHLNTEFMWDLSQQKVIPNNLRILNLLACTTNFGINSFLVRVLYFVEYST